MDEPIKHISLKKEDATDRTKWRNGVYELSRIAVLNGVLCEKSGGLQKE